MFEGLATKIRGGATAAATPTPAPSKPPKASGVFGGLAQKIQAQNVPKPAASTVPAVPAKSLAFSSPLPLPPTTASSGVSTTPAPPMAPVKSMAFPVGAGMKNTTDVLPGPRRATLEAIKRGEQVNVTSTPTQSSEVTPAKLALGIEPTRTAPESYGKIRQGALKVQDAFEPFMDPNKNIAVKIIQKPVGAAVGTMGAVFGAGIGAEGNIVKNLLLGKGIHSYDTPESRKKFWEDVISTSKSTAELGQTVGEQGAAMAPIGALSEVGGVVGAAGEVINALGMIPQISQIYTDVKTGNITVETGLNAGMALMFGLGATKSLPKFAESLRAKSDVNSIVSAAADSLGIVTEKDVFGRIKPIDSATMKQWGEIKDGATQVEVAKQILEDHKILLPEAFKEKYQKPLLQVADMMEQTAAKSNTQNPVVEQPLKPEEQVFAGLSDKIKTDGAVVTGEKPTSQEVPVAPETGAAAVETKPIESPKLSPEIRVTVDEPTKQMQSRVFERLQAENPELTGELAYERQNLQANAEKAVALIAEDGQKAFRIAMGAEEPPAGQTSTAINIALAEKALADGNNTLYAKLVKNRSLEQTRRGQEIVAEKGSVTDNSTSRYVKELVKARLDKLDSGFLAKLSDRVLKKGKKSRAIEVIDREVGKVKDIIKKSKTLDIVEAQKLIDSLACS